MPWWIWTIYGIVTGVGLFGMLLHCSESYGFDSAKDGFMWFAGIVLWPLTAVVAVIYGTLLALYRVQLMFQSACYEIAKEYRKEVKRNDLTSL